MSVTLPSDVCPPFVANVRHILHSDVCPPFLSKCLSHLTFRCLSPLSFKMSVTFNLRMSVPLLLFIGDNPSARRRRNHCTVEEGVHVVPTLRNRVVIFLYPGEKMNYYTTKIVTNLTLFRVFHFNRHPATELRMFLKNSSSPSVSLNAIKWGFSLNQITVLKHVFVFIETTFLSFRFQTTCMLPFPFW